MALVFAVAVVGALLLTPLIRRGAYRLGALDHPAERKTHVTSLPRLGGISIVIAWTAALATAALDDSARQWLRTAPFVAIVLGALLVFAVGLWDDVRPLAPGTKILAEFVAATMVVGAGILIERVTFFGTTIQLGWLSTAATVLWIVGITNAFNLLDGLDGLATGLAIIAGGTCTAIVLIRGDQATAVLLVALLGALVGFLPYNFNPASIFMGDGGSLTAGFVLGVTAITGWQKGATALAIGVPLLIFALPIADTSATVVRRLVRGGALRGSGARSALERLMRPDREHIHHALMARGLSHRAAVLVLYAAALAFSAAALLTMERP